MNASSINFLSTNFFSLLSRFVFISRLSRMRRNDKSITQKRRFKLCMSNIIPWKEIPDNQLNFFFHFAARDFEKPLDSLNRRVEKKREERKEKKRKTLFMHNLNCDHATADLVQPAKNLKSSSSMFRPNIENPILSTNNRFSLVWVQFQFAPFYRFAFAKLKFLDIC